MKTDAFGHKKLGGSGKYVREKLNILLKNDFSMADFYKNMGLYIKDMNEMPEIRESVPGYLTRSGYSSAIDINFGRDTGAAAVLLLTQGISGVTVTGVVAGKIRFMETAAAITQRQVPESMIAFYEQMGICFGREPAVPVLSAEKVDATWCYF